MDQGENYLFSFTFQENRIKIYNNRDDFVYIDNSDIWLDSIWSHLILYNILKILDSIGKINIKVNDVIVGKDLWIIKNNILSLNLNENIKITISLKTNYSNSFLIENNIIFPYNLLYIYLRYGIMIKMEKEVKLLGEDELCTEGEEKVCIVCMEYISKIMYKSCKHLCICFSCYSKVKEKNVCIFCRTKTDISTDYKITEVFIP
jgi:hypothetical protein